MAVRRAACLLVLALLCSTTAVPARANDAADALEVVSAERTIEAKTHVVKHVTDFRVRASAAADAANEPPSSMRILYEGVQSSGLSYLKATQRNKTSKKLEKMRFELEHTKEAGGTTIVTLHFKQPLQGTEEDEVRVTSVFMDMVSPKGPMEQSEEPILVYRGDSHHILSPYAIGSQKTTIASTQIRNFSPLPPQSPSAAASEIAFGPYVDVQPMSRSPMVVSFVQAIPQPYVDRLVRTVEVSHWAGTVQVNDAMRVTNVAPAVKGEFSRYEFSNTLTQKLMLRQQTGQLGDGPTTLNDVNLQIMNLQLPVNSRPIYYRDVNGNISTSDVREIEGHKFLSLITRYPLMGGWSAEFEYGYTLPLSSVAAHGDDGDVRLFVPFGVLNDQFAAKDFELRVALPEGASDISMRPPYKVESEFGTSASYLDTVGRPVLIVRKTNVIWEHRKPLEVRYALPAYALLQEPLILIGVFFLFFACMIAMGRADFRLVKEDEDADTKEAAGATKRKKNA